MTAPALVIWCELCRVRGATVTATIATDLITAGEPWLAMRWTRDLCPTCRRTATEAWRSLGLVVTVDVAHEPGLALAPEATP